MTEYLRYQDMIAKERQHDRRSDLLALAGLLMTADRTPQPRSSSSAQTAIALMRAGRRMEAVPHLERAAAAGDPHAQYLLGVALYNGDDVAGDTPRALKLLEAAAAAGVPQAQGALNDVAGSTGPADQNMLVSARCAEHISAEFARLAPVSSDPSATLEAVARELLVPLLRERLEEMLPRSARRAIDEALRTRAGDQDRPEKS